MDAISQCEQYAKEQGRQERNAPWRLFFRKEIFSPWHNAKADDVSTKLIYQQVIRGIKFGEYRSDKEEDLATLAAQQYYIDYGPQLDIDKLEENLHIYIPEFEMKNAKGSNHERWLQLVMHAFRKHHPTALEVQEDVVSFAKRKWPLLFSRFYEAYKFAGPPLPKNEVIIAVNWTGVYVIDDEEQVLLEFSFPEITCITCTSSTQNGTNSCTIQTIGQVEYTFQSPNAEDIRELVDYFLDGLKKRSTFLVALHDHRPTGQHKMGQTLVRYRQLAKSTQNGTNSCTIQTIGQVEYTFQSPNAEDIRELVDYFLDGLKKRSTFLVALHDHRPTDVNTYLAFKHGDLLLLAEGITGEALRKNQFVRGENTRTGLQGNIPVELVYVLPTITKPTMEIMDMFARQPEFDSPMEKQVAILTNPLTSRPYTLERFAADNFRAPSRRTTLTINPRRQDRAIPQLWMHSREPLKAPLLKKLTGKEEPSQEAVIAYMAIMKYMGDHPSRKAPSRRTTLTINPRRQDRAIPQLWMHSREPLKAPLLKKLTGKEEPSQEAVIAYMAIMKYMGDHPSRKLRTGIELTDIIFRGPLKYEILRDELYCQLMKQLTNNYNALSEERGWELLWLCIGLFPPSQSLLKEVTQFLRTRAHPVAADCYNRLQKTLRLKISFYQ
uniref:MyTH4 domain-containing protein n=1 Tax=Ascaris lumbricoides TaxID=6252 RepID=A0A0M3IQF6_ASCLU